MLSTLKALRYSSYWMKRKINKSRILSWVKWNNTLNVNTRNKGKIKVNKGQINGLIYLKNIFTKAQEKETHHEKVCNLRKREAGSPNCLSIMTDAKYR